MRSIDIPERTEKGLPPIRVGEAHPTHEVRGELYGRAQRFHDGKLYRKRELKWVSNIDGSVQERGFEFEEVEGGATPDLNDAYGARVAERVAAQIRESLESDALLESFDAGCYTGRLVVEQESE